jgi:hypothetical protein
MSVSISPVCCKEAGSIGVKFFRGVDAPRMVRCMSHCASLRGLEQCSTIIMLIARWMSLVAGVSAKLCKTTLFESNEF